MTGRDNVIAFLGMGLGLLFGLVGHEYAHARAADTFGDKTARLHGRLTLNPAAHVDPLGTLILPGIFLISVLVGRPLGVVFGWAKPVPISPHRMRSPRTHAMLTALAGPATNLLLAGVAAFLYRTLTDADVRTGLVWFILVNVFLTIINALPIPPLDGSKILARFLSPRAAYRMEELGQYGLLFLLVLFFIFQDQLSAMAGGVIDALIG